MTLTLVDRVRGCAVGAAVGDALGMPLEFGPPQPVDALVREMRGGRIPAGSFTDDTEMALALAHSLLAQRPLDPADLAGRFVAWLETYPPDVGIHTSTVLSRVAGGEPWDAAATAVQRFNPDSAGNGSVMRCWPVALAYHNDLARLLAESALQSRVTHPHAECVAGSAFGNAAIYHLLAGADAADAVARAVADADIPAPLRAVIEAAPGRERDALHNTGWVRHTLESAVWGLLATDTFEDAVVAVVNLGRDADTAGAVAGALAGAAYGLSGIPQRWRDVLQGEYGGRHWDVDALVALADNLAALT